MKGQQMGAHDALVLEIERGKHRDRLYEGITKLMHAVPEPIDEEHRSIVGIEDEPQEEKRPKTTNGLARLMKQKEERSTQVKVDPRVIVQHLVHKVAQSIGIDLPGWWHASVITGLGDNHTYQEGDTVKLYPATTGSLEAMPDRLTPKGSAATIQKTIGGPPKKKKEPTPKRDWIQELCARGETQIWDSKQFADQIDTEKMVTMTTDGGANPNPGPAC
jgi:hypothetical protein